MSYFLQRHRSGRLAAFLFLALLAAASAHSQERADCRAFHSALLHSSVRYCVYLPASYSAADAKTRKYPVLYLLHGLGGNEQAMALDGEWTSLQDLRREHMVGRISGRGAGRLGYVLHQFTGRENSVQRFLPARIHSVCRAHLSGSDGARRARDHRFFDGRVRSAANGICASGAVRFGQRA